MNTKPDETTLARWLEDDLQGAELAAFEESVRGDAELHDRREFVRAMRRDLAALIPAVEEPAYPEFFNSRIEKSIREMRPAPARAGGGWSWRAWWMPATAMAGMAMAFWLGTVTGNRREVVVAPPPPAETVTVTVVEPGLYTPERGVDAEWFSSEDAAATVIVLEGVDAIPDAMDFSATVGIDDSGSQSTAGTNSRSEGGLRQ